MKLSIIIPVYNKWAYTKNCLKDLSKLSNDYEIIIIDNGSSDETQKEILNYNINYIRNNANLGYAKANNIGFKSATSENILFLNNDVKVQSLHESWPEDLIKELEEDCLVGPTGGFIDIKNNFKFNYETSDSLKPINYMSGWCLAATKTTLNKLNIGASEPEIFSEEFGRGYWEDTDLSFRASKLNIKFKLIKIPIVHYGKVTSQQLNTYELYSKARNIFINKWTK